MDNSFNGTRIVSPWSFRRGRKLADLNTHELAAFGAGLAMASESPEKGSQTLAHIQEELAQRGHEPKEIAELLGYVTA